MKYTINVVELTHNDLVDILSAAFYGNHYLALDYEVSDYEKIPQNERNGGCMEDIAADILLNGGTLMITDCEADGECYTKTLPYKINDGSDEFNEGTVTYFVTIDDFYKGMSLEDSAEYIHQFVNETADMWTGYNLIQMILFGKLIYG